ncbi:MAG: dihydrolipoyl dehydrogenase family protein [Oryzihumus sp.]
MSDAVDESFDVIVVGAGAVGENAADRAGRSGLKVMVVERRLVGGECSFYACTPTKAMLRPVHAAHAAQRVRGVAGAHLVPAEVMARRDYWISDLDDSGAVGWLESVGIALVRGTARLVGERLVEVDGTTYRAGAAVVVATGTSPAVPDLPGLRDAKPWTNIEATTSSTVPERLVILGGGVVACETAQIYCALGSRVTLVERGARLLGRAEPFASSLVAAALAREGVDVRLGVSVTAVSRPEPGGEATVTLSDGSTVAGDEVMVAMGRTPNPADLGLEVVGAEVDESGYVVVDDSMRVTSVPGDWLYAVGDVTGRNLLTHMGKYQARVAGDIIAARGAGRATDGPGMRAWADHLGAPQVVFTDPEVSSVGLTEAAARERGMDVRVVNVKMRAASGAGLQADEYEGYAQIVVDEGRRVVVGATFVGQDTAEMVHAAGIAVVGEVPLERLWHVVPSFPTMSEIWLRLLEHYGL